MGADERRNDAAPARRLLFVRHAHAVDRASWPGEDDERPLSPRGRLQAAALAASLGSAEVGRVLSSPAERCVATVEQIASAARCELERSDRYSEGSDPALALEAGLAAVAALDGETTVVACSHGDVLDGIVAALGARGARMGRKRSVHKAGSVEVVLVGDAVASAEVLAPPDQPG